MSRRARSATPPAAATGGAPGPSDPESGAIPADERYYVASQWQLMWRKFRRHRMALVGGGVLLFLYLTTGVAGFLSPYEKASRDADYLLAPPQRVRLFHDGRLLGPFVYSLERTRDPETLQRIYTENTADPHRIRFFVRTDRYKFLGFIRTDLHLFGVLPPATLYLFGTDELAATCSRGCCTPVACRCRWGCSGSPSASCSAW